MVGKTGNFGGRPSLDSQFGETESQDTHGEEAPDLLSSEDSEGFAPNPHGIFATLDSDSDESISESEYNESIVEVTGSEVTSNFVDFDT